MDAIQLEKTCRIPLDPQHPIIGTDGRTILDFWRWAYSDLIYGNTNRGYFGQFLVGCALGIASHECMLEWETWDFTYKGVKIEVKTKTRVRTTVDIKRASISFEAPETLLLDRTTNSYVGSKKRWADIFIFAYYEELEPTKEKITDANRWEFYVAPNKNIPPDGKIGLCDLRKKYQMRRVNELRDEVESIICGLSI